MYRILALVFSAAVALGCAPSENPGANVQPGPEEKAPKELPSVGPEPQKANPAQFSGLESAQGWTVETWGGPATVSQGSEPDLGDFLKIETAVGDKDKTAVGRVMFGVYGENGLRMDFFNKNREPIKVALGIFVGAKRRYYESPIVTVPAGWSSQAFNLITKQWKSEESGWKFTEAPEAGVIVQLDIIIYEKNPVTLYVTYIAQPMPPKEPAPEPVAQPEQPQNAPAVEKPQDNPKPAVPERPGEKEPVLTPEQEKQLGAKLTPADREEILKVLKSMEEPK
jgi:hypothetical protein